MKWPQNSGDDGWEEEEVMTSENTDGPDAKKRRLDAHSDVSAKPSDDEDDAGDFRS